MTTAEPIKFFQLKHNLTPDGKIGAKTCAKMREIWGLSKEQLAHFLGQGHIESGDWSKMRENMNYSAERLGFVFGKYFPDKPTCDAYEFKAEKIANYVYDDKNRSYNSKLGNTQLGDGWKYRASGIGITGRENVTRFAKFIRNLNIIENPDLIWQEYYFESWLFFFMNKKIWIDCLTVDNNSCKKVTRIVNGGENHLKERTEKTIYYFNLQK